MVVNNLLLPKELHLAQAGLTDLPNDWLVVEVGELLSPDRGISVGVMYPGKHDPLGIPLLKVGDLTGSVINPNPEFRITPEKHYEYRRTALEEGEILLTLVGGLGQCAIVPPQMAGWNAARAIAVIRLKEPKDAKFVRLCFLSPPLQHLMQVWANTTVQATLNLKEIKLLPLPFPPAAEREAIAHILGILDDKIELNREMNQTLEAMARAIFKSWFVDFDPVRAKMEGRQPAGMDAATAELFPDEFEESALGMIPKGWKVGTFSDLVEIKKGDIVDGPFGSNLKSSDYTETGVRLIHQQNIEEFNFIDDKKRYTSLEKAVSLQRSAAYPGDIVFTKMPEPITRAARIPKGIADQFIIMADCIRVRPHPEITPSVYLLHLINSNLFRQGAEARATGTTRPRINLTQVKSIPIVIPQKEVRQAIATIIEPLEQMRENNYTESRSLASIRGTLLPKLLSGEIRVKEAEKVLEALT